jgi:Zn-dependent M28 family amino/carboxypeptidase
MAVPVRRTASVRNVIGLLRGSDPELRETYVLVTAHYDHLGLSSSVGDDKTYNGANDDGSGTVSVIELATALASVPTRPKRSLIFMTFFGEERGMLGSRYYVSHPVVPLDKTVADVNLEQLGRTDSSDGVPASAASMTGFDYSSLGPTFARAGQRMGIRVSKHERFSDGFFRASDNFSFAQRGIPAHTICVAYHYPDYHGLGDHWDKVDFPNMARVDRMLALGILILANDQERPTWNASNPRAAPFARAAKK